MPGVSGCTITDFFELADQLPAVTRADNGRYWRVAVTGQTFGYLWEPTRTVGLKQTLAEQLALVAERPTPSRCSSPRPGSAGSSSGSRAWSATSWPS